MMPITLPIENTRQINFAQPLSDWASLDYHARSYIMLCNEAMI